MAGEAASVVVQAVARAARVADLVVNDVGVRNWKVMHREIALNPMSRSRMVIHRQGSRRTATHLSDAMIVPQAGRARILGDLEIQGQVAVPVDRVAGLAAGRDLADSVRVVLGRVVLGQAVLGQAVSDRAT